MKKQPCGDFGLLSLLMLLPGCSVAMALSGNQEPNFEAFEVGSTRKQVEIQLGQPRATQTSTDGKRTDTYQYEVGNSPNGHRAVWNFYMDLATFGIWELPGTIIEVTMGHKEVSQVVYDANDKVVEIQGFRPPPVSEELKKAREAQEKYKKPKEIQTAPPSIPPTP